MDYSSQHGLSRFTGRKMMIFLYVLLLCSCSTTRSSAILTENENATGKPSTTEPSKSEVSKREEPKAQRRDHSFNPDGTVNYHGSGSGHDSGDLVPPPGGSIFNSPSIELSLGHTGPTSTGLSNSYGVPIPADSYGPPKHIFGDVKPPGGFPPKSTYGPPSNKYLPPPKHSYGPPSGHSSSLPKPVYGPPQFRPPSPPKPVYGAPSFSQFPSKPSRPKPGFGSRPKPVYGPPKPSFGTSGFSHGTPLSPVSSIKPQYGPPKISATYGTPLQPSTSYRAPKHPKHGHIKTPPTPPDVKYDGWKPIPGLVSNAPSGSYGAPDNSGHGVGFSSIGHISGGGFDSVSHPPSSSYGAPSGFGGGSFGGTSFGSSGFGIQLKPSSSYGPPSSPSLSYGTPLQPSTSYGPPSFKGPSKGSFLSSLKPPSSSYGLPDISFSSGPSKPGHSFGSLKPPSSSYGTPHISSSYGPPKSPSISYGPPKSPGFSFGGPKAPSSSFRFPKPPGSSYGPPKPPSSSYGPPKITSISFRPPKSPSGSYGPPKIPSSAYGPPSQPPSSYGPPSGISGSFIPPKPPSSYGPPKAPSSSYGPPKAPSSSYGPPKAPSSSYGPPKAPSSSYGPPKAPSSSYGPPQIFTTYSIPKPGLSLGGTPSTAYRGPPVPHPLQPPSTFGAPSFSGGLYKAPLPPNALYGVPTVSGPPTGLGCCGPPPVDLSFQPPSNAYGLPITGIQAPVIQQVPSIEIGTQFLSTGPAAVLPSPVPSQSYGAPVLPATPTNPHHPPSDTYGVPTALPLRQPKNPVKFRPPVPQGLISSIGAKWSDSAFWAANAQSHKFHDNTYIPPAVPDPDPGTHANQGNALVIPPPSAPPINYGPPPSGQQHESHHQVSNQFSSSSGSAEHDLNPPPPAPSSYDIQQSSSIELPNSNNLDHHGGSADHSSFSSGVTSYNAPIDTSSSHGPTGPASSSVQHIPIQGNQGSYTLQIQAAGGNSGEHIPHSEVLSNGLLQDILAAIENPGASGKLEQYGHQQSDPVASEIGLNILKQLGGTDAQKSNSVQLPTQYGSDLSHASSSNIAQYSKAADVSNEVLQGSVTTSQPEVRNSTDGKIAHYLNQNKIALYFNNQEESVEERKGDAKDIVLVQMSLPNSSAIAQRSEHDTLVSVQNAQSSTARSLTESSDTVS